MEQWKEIRGYEGIYEVSNLGNVRSMDRIIEMKNGGKREYYGQELTKCFCHGGYPKVNLYDSERKCKTWRIHTLVALHFVDNPNGHTYVNHKNECKTDNRADNLFWTTNLENNSRGGAICKRKLGAKQR